MVKIELHEDRYFSPDSRVREIAIELYHSVAKLPIVAPHGHVDPSIFASEDFRFSNPSELFVIPDHYLFRMLSSQGIDYRKVGVPTIDGSQTETDPRKIWQKFADNFHLLMGTPTGGWLLHEFKDVFGVEDILDASNAQAIYDHIDTKLKSPDFSPRKLYEKFNIEVLCTTDAATDSLEHHQAIKDSDWDGAIRPTFRPDLLINDLGSKAWRDNIAKLRDVCNMDIGDFDAYLKAIRARFEHFIAMGATATDHGALTPYTLEVSSNNMNTLFKVGLRESDIRPIRKDTFRGAMMLEMAKMCIDYKMTMQFHAGSLRDYDPKILREHGKDKGYDIPMQVDFTHGLMPLLNQYGNNKDFRLIVFTLDEDTYSRELAPLAGAYSAMMLGPPWWFHDSPNGIKRYLDRVVETAGIYNLAGFNDDTRAFPSIPARHDVWRRVCADWLAERVARHIPGYSLENAKIMIKWLAYDAAKEAYRLTK